MWLWRLEPNVQSVLCVFLCTRSIIDVWLVELSCVVDERQSGEWTQDTATGYFFIV